VMPYGSKSESMPTIGILSTNAWAMSRRSMGIKKHTHYMYSPKSSTPSR
jgi:hypothetical protein